ncbi:MAG: hypothetical protein OER90_10575 [Gemmatimonadota bacterium]|nr:hypothetical protein [Gemmatimonadota bacterium]
MWKPILTVAAVGVGGFVLWQLVWAVLMPVVGGILGFLLAALKVGLLILLAYWIYRVVTNNKKQQNAEG